MKTLVRVLGCAVVAMASVVMVAPAAGARTDPTSVTTRPHECDDLVASRSRHHHHHHHHHHDGDDGCGPPPVVPEVPIAVLLPLTGAGIVAIAFGVRRRRGPAAYVPASTD